MQFPDNPFQMQCACGGDKFNFRGILNHGSISLWVQCEKCEKDYIMGVQAMPPLIFAKMDGDSQFKQVVIDEFKGLGIAEIGSLVLKLRPIM